jgi:hypothetical protein
MGIQQIPISRGLLIDEIETCQRWTIRSIENWNNLSLQSFTVVLTFEGDFFGAVQKDRLELFLVSFGWKIHETLWVAGNAACFVLKPFAEKPTRPPIGAVVQMKLGDGWDYTGLVTKHHPDLNNTVWVQWHKWGNEDDHTLWGWEYNPNNYRVIDKPVRGQWWPTKE